MPDTNLSGSAFLTDSAAFNITDLLGSGPKDLSMVIDLLEFAQAAMLSEQIYVTPGALEFSDFLRGLDFVTTVKLAENNTGADSSSAPEPAAESILIDLDDQEHLIANDPLGDLLLAIVYSLKLRQAPVVNLLCNPTDTSSGEDTRRLKSLRYLMILAQFSRNILPFEDEDSKKSLSDVLVPALHDYREYSVSLYRLSQHWGMETLSSVLEQPLLALTTLDFPLRNVPGGALMAEIGERLNTAITTAPGRKEFFEQWRIPPLGIISLQDMDDPDKIQDALIRGRDRFSKLRQSIAHNNSQRQALLQAADFRSLDGEKALRDLAAMDRERAQILEVFDQRIQQKHTSFARTETVFNFLDYTLELIGGLDFGIIGFISAKLGLKQRALLQRIPGLLRAQSDISRGNDLLALEWISRIIPDARQVRSQNLMLDLAFGHAQSYSATNPGSEPEEFNTMDLGDSQLSDRIFWMTLLRLDEFNEAFLNGSLLTE